MKRKGGAEVTVAVKVEVARVEVAVVVARGLGMTGGGVPPPLLPPPPPPVGTYVQVCERTGLPPVQPSGDEVTTV